MKGKMIARGLVNIPIVALGIASLACATASGLILREMLCKDPEEVPEYLIVLGARVHGELPGEALKSRLEKAAQFLHQHPDTIAVLSGGCMGDAAISEAECMRRGLLQKGIDPHRLILEPSARTTDENILYSLMLIPDGATVGLLSNDFHAFRIKRFVRRCGQRASVFRAKCPKEILLKAFLREDLAVIVWAATGKL